jgi:DNA-binding CsgD family transcriptional regulator
MATAALREGIARSSVATHLWQAARKLGLRSRLELVGAFEQMSAIE